MREICAGRDADAQKRALILRRNTTNKSPLFMNFVRGSSTDSNEKGEQYAWGNGGGAGVRRSLPLPVSHGARRPAKRAKGRGGSDDDDDENDESYFDDDDDGPPAPAAADDDDDPLDAFMSELEGKSTAKPAAPQASAAAAATAPAPSAAAQAAARARAAAAAVSASASQQQQQQQEEEEEEDPLDAYMAGLEKKQSAPPKSIGAPPASGRKATVRGCDEEEDHIASFMEQREREAAESHGGDSDDEGGGGASGPRRMIGQQGKGKQLDGLAEVDHDSIEYAAFEKELYRPHPTIRTMSAEEVASYRRELHVSTTGFDVPAPIKARAFKQLSSSPCLHTSCCFLHT